MYTVLVMKIKFFFEKNKTHDIAFSLFFASAASLLKFGQYLLAELFDRKQLVRIFLSNIFIHPFFHHLPLLLSNKYSLHALSLLIFSSVSKTFLPTFRAKKGCDRAAREFHSDANINGTLIQFI